MASSNGDLPVTVTSTTVRMNSVKPNVPNQIGVGAKPKYTPYQQQADHNNMNRSQSSDIPFSSLEIDAKPNDGEQDNIPSRNVVQQTPSVDEARKFIYGEDSYLDVAVVYAKEDYDEVDQSFLPWLKHTCRNLREEPRIVLYDDESLPPHNMECIEYIIERSMRIFIYLTSNFNKERQMKFLTQESVSNTRLANSFAVEHYVMSQKRWAVRPVHTKSDDSRNYKTPIGLSAVNGIDFYHRDRLHTQKKAIRLIEDAISDRKTREFEEGKKKSGSNNSSMNNSSMNHSSTGASSRDYSHGQNNMNAQSIPAALSVSDTVSSGDHSCLVGPTPSLLQGASGNSHKNSRVLEAGQVSSLSDSLTQNETASQINRSIGTEIQGTNRLPANYNGHTFTQDASFSPKLSTESGQCESNIVSHGSIGEPVMVSVPQNVPQDREQDNTDSSMAAARETSNNEPNNHKPSDYRGQQG